MYYYTLNQVRLFLGLLFCFLSGISTWAQGENYFTISLDLYTDLPSASTTNQYSSSVISKDIYFTASALETDDDLMPKGDVEVINTPSYFRQHKAMPTQFSGYVIELLQSDERLAIDYPLFEHVGNVHVQQLENGKYAYCILADFNKAESVKKFVENIIVHLAPEAQAFKYKKGKRKKM
ncbi:MAG: hypothetical protein AAF573_07525 [Bacteroidota bacterium]